MNDTIAIIQIVISIALVVLILLQQRDSETAGFLGGGGGGGGFYQQRRGLERLFFVSTIVLAVAFAALALASLLYHEPVLPVAPADAADVINMTASSTDVVE